MAGAGLLKSSLYDQLQKAALKEGFIEAGGVDLESAWPAYSEHVQKYDEWIARGNAGEMHYLARGRDRRANPRLVFPETQAVFTVLLPYRKLPVGHLDPSQGIRYARYLDGDDYHDRLAVKLEQVLRAVSAENPTFEMKWKVCVDTSAVLERTWAALSGLGWIGKNTLLIHPKHGSYTFIGVALLNTPLHQKVQLLPDYCGHCSRCITSCPTQAIESPRSVNSRKCIAYWTLEKRGDLALEISEKKRLGNWVAGCDLCQEACPFNLKPTREEEQKNTTEKITEVGAVRVSDWNSILSETDDDYRKRVKNSALSRVKPEMFRRNVKIAHENSGSIGTGTRQ